MGGDTLTVAIAIPTISVRVHLLARALESVANQTRKADQIVVVEDVHRVGPSATRNACLDQVKTDYVAWLDDDDYLHENHLELCMAVTPEYDFIYPWYTREDRFDPFKVDHKPLLGWAWDARLERAIMYENNFIPITTVIRTDLLRSIGGFPLPWSEDWPHPSNEDWGCWKRLLAAGAKVHHVPHQTWHWCRHGIDRRPRGRVGS